MVFLKTAGQTAKKNKLTQVSNKIVADFTQLDAFFKAGVDCGNYNFTAAELLSKTKDAIANVLDPVSGHFAIAILFVNGIKFHATVMMQRCYVYVDGKLRYSVCQIDALRLTAFNGNQRIWHTEFNAERFDATYQPAYVDLD